MQMFDVKGRNNGRTCRIYSYFYKNAKKLIWSAHKLPMRVWDTEMGHWETSEVNILV